MTVVGLYKMEQSNKKTIIDIVKEIETKLIEEELSARQILMVLRELENNATIALVIGSLIKNNGDTHV